MNLQQVVGALERNNIQIALDIGVHKYCSIDSNCPLAIELRRIINESDITLPQLLEGFVASQEAPPEQLPCELPEFSSKVILRIAGQDVELNLEDVIRAQLGHALDRKREEIDTMGKTITRLGKGLFSSYLYEITELRNKKTLPQLCFSRESLIRANCLINADGKNYIFLFARRYNPVYIVARGIRFKIADEDILALMRDIYLSYTISLERMILDTHILDSNGEDFTHYHGDRRDCWGLVKIPERWSGRLESLCELTTQLMGALHTINRDSLMNSSPRDMPHIDALMERSTLLGKEGELEVGESIIGGGGTPGRWGEREGETTWRRG